MKREEMIQMFTEAINDGDMVRDLFEDIFDAGYAKGYSDAEKKYNVKTENETHSRPLSPYERTRNAVYATGNKWAIENFNATH